MKHIINLGAILLLYTLLHISLFSHHAIAEEPCAYSVGVVPQFDQRRIHSVWVPILQELSQKIGCELSLVGSKSIAGFENEIKEGKFDFAYVNPVQVWLGHKKQGYVPLVRSSAKKLKGILVVRKDDQIQGLKELEGEKIAFPSPIAIGATLLPQEELQAQGVGYVPQYVNTHGSVYFHVAKGLMRAGGGVGRTLNEQPDYIKKALRIIYTSRGISPHAFAVHGRVSEAMMNDIQRAWFELWQESPALFSGIPMLNPEKPLVADYESLEKWIIE